MKDFLTVKEFAELANKKPQTIYKQLEKRLKPYVTIHKGQKMISSEALKDFYGVEQPIQPDSTVEIQPNSTDFQPDSTDFQPDSTVEIQPDSTAKNDEKAKPDKENEQIEALNKLIEIIQKQLEEKDKQLAVKDKQIQDLSDRLAEAMQLTRGQQYITAADKTKELIEADSERNTQQDKDVTVTEYENTPMSIKVESNLTQEQKQPQKKKSFFARIFGF